MRKVIVFLKEYMPDLEGLSLRDCPTKLTLSNLIQVSLYALKYTLKTIHFNTVSTGYSTYDL